MNPEAYAAKRLKGVEMSAIRLISDRARALRAQGHEVAPVSYTHLAQQELQLAALVAAQTQARQVVPFQEDAGTADGLAQTVQLLQGRGPVSYTHLDVYKRQTLARSSSRSKNSHALLPPGVRSQTYGESVPPKAS